MRRTRSARGGKSRTSGTGARGPGRRGSGALRTRRPTSAALPGRQLGRSREGRPGGPRCSGTSSPPRRAARRRGGAPRPPSRGRPLDRRLQPTHKPPKRWCPRPPPASRAPHRLSWVARSRTPRRSARPAVRGSLRRAAEIMGKLLFSCPSWRPSRRRAHSLSRRSRLMPTTTTVTSWRSDAMMTKTTSWKSSGAKRPWQPRRLWWKQPLLRLQKKKRRRPERQLPRS
mmetsp:Transcript_116147/g.370631  ORF Transcript_116147/g.370631 Transcript_116147/m.370631 type:complete len:228 (-) Transcript_116147:1305-1988(-)